MGGAGGLTFTDLLTYHIGNGLGWEIARMGQGGTGYVTDPAGAGAPYTDATRLANLAAQKLDYAIILGSINDSAQTPSAVGAAAASVYSYMATNSPQTKLIVVGVEAIPTTPAGNSVANNAAIKAAALAAPNVVKFLDPLGDQWITSADSSLMIYRAHLNANGHLTWARRFNQELVGI